MPADQTPHGVATERGSPRAREHRLMRLAGTLGKQHLHAAARQRRGAFFPALSLATQMGTGVEMDVLPAQCDELGHAQPRLHANQQEGMVTPADPT
jgi:hypothetical protein